MIAGCNNPAPAFHSNGTLFVVCNEFELTSIDPNGAGGGLDGGEWAPLQAIGGNQPSDGRHWEDAHLWFDSQCVLIC